MTALSEYDRLEASGLWCPGPDQQRRDVIVSIGNATLVIADTNDVALTHWSLPAVERANPGKIPAVFFPDGDPGETLELAETETEMIEAIGRLQTAIERGRPHPGRLRLFTFLASLMIVLALTVFWLPGALLNHTVSVVPDAKRHDIGATLLTQTRRLTGPFCSDPIADPVLTRLGAHFGIRSLHVVRNGVRETLSLPGGILLINRALIEDHEEPDVVAGYIIAETARNQAIDPLHRFLRSTGLRSIFRLLTTGSVTQEDARTYVEGAVATLPLLVNDDLLLQAFHAQGVRSTPYAFALDVSGETTLGLIEADPFAGAETEPLVSDGDWVALQGICENG